MKRNLYFEMCNELTLQFSYRLFFLILISLKATAALQNHRQRDDIIPDDDDDDDDDDDHDDHDDDDDDEIENIQYEGKMKDETMTLSTWAMLLSQALQLYCCEHLELDYLARTLRLIQTATFQRGIQRTMQKASENLWTVIDTFTFMKPDEEITEIPKLSISVMTAMKYITEQSKSKAISYSYTEQKTRQCKQSHVKK
uniref:Uncharacterized protein n=1 Tax=Glossina austeni TaxID=7395 RepID=A0A1A9VC45_GLOAU